MSLRSAFATLGLCLALSTGAIARDRVPVTDDVQDCNAFCRRWMGQLDEPAPRPPANIPAAHDRGSAPPVTLARKARPIEGLHAAAARVSVLAQSRKSTPTAGPHGAARTINAEVPRPEPATPQIARLLAASDAPVAAAHADPAPAAALTGSAPAAALPIASVVHANEALPPASPQFAAVEPHPPQPQVPEISNAGLAMSRQALSLRLGLYALLALVFWGMFIRRNGRTFEGL